MRALSAAAMLLLAAASAAAQVTDADLALRVVPSVTPARPGQGLTWVITALNNGPSSAQNVTVTAEIPGDPSVVPGFSLACVSGHPVRCTIPGLEPNSTSGVAFINAKAPATPETYVLAAAIGSSTHDPNPDNNTIAVSLTVSDAPDASVFLPRFLSDRVLAGEHRVTTVSVGTGSRVLHDVRLTLAATGLTLGAIEPPPGFTCAARFARRASSVRRAARSACRSTLPTAMTAARSRSTRT